MAGITIDIGARVVGYEASIKQLREDFKKLDPGSSIGKSIDKALKEAESRVANLGKNLTPKITSDSQLESYAEKINLTGQSIQEVANLMQKVKIGDIDFSSFDNGIQKMLQDLQTLETELESRITSGFQSAIASSQELSQSLKNLNIATENKSAGQIFDELSEKAKQAAADTDAAAKALEAAETNLSKKQSALELAKSNPVFQKDEVEAQFKDVSKLYTDTFDKIKQQVQDGLMNLLGDSNPQSKKIYEAFLKDLSPQTLREHLTALKNSIQAELQNGISAQDIYKSLFGLDFGSRTSSANIEPVLLKDLRPQLETIKQKFQEELQRISPSLTPKQTGQITSLISKEQIEQALTNTIKYIEDAFLKVDGEVTQKTQEVFDAQKVVDTAKDKHETATSNENFINTSITNLQDKLNDVIKDNERLNKEIETLRAQITGSKEKIAGGIRDSSQKSGKNAEDFKVPKTEMQQYQKQLDQVHAKEKLVGKIEGVVQRWFSIYAAVRMVSNAIKSVISTVKELDKTITEIAIVTDMTQQDLWGQMKSYTDMARQYAASISGVYQVSQLYYQQGKLNI